MFADMLNDAQKAAIADVTIESAQLEVELERCIIQLCKLWWPHGSVLLENVRLEGKLTVFEKLLAAEYAKTVVPEGFRVACDQLRNLNTQRNTIVHGEWMLKSMAEESFSDVNPSALRKDVVHKNIVAHRRKREKSPQPVPARNIKKIAELMALNRQLIHQLFWEHFPDRVTALSGLPSSPERSSKKLLSAIRARSQNRK